MTEVNITPEVEALFTKYERYAQRWDFKSVMKLYGGKLAGASPQGVAFWLNNLFTRWRFDRGMKAFYEQAGLTSMRILRMQEQKISESYSMVMVTWNATFKKTIEQSLEFHISYLVRKKKGGVEIVLFVAHEDEGKVLKGYDIIK
jgi:hypothetical protein